MSISKRHLLILYSIIILLLVPFVAMQFSSEVNWSLFDFLVAGGLLTVLGFSIDFAIRKATSTQMRFALIAGIVVVFLLVWAELAVGVFGTPFAGS